VARAGKIRISIAYFFFILLANEEFSDFFCTQKKIAATTCYRHYLLKSRHKPNLVCIYCFYLLTLKRFFLYSMTLTIIGHLKSGVACRFFKRLVFVLL
jgi:hypothetical protein